MAQALADLETPAAILDLDRLETSIRRLQAYLAEHRIANRPHIKTHKIPGIARQQVAAGAVGITCQKLAEAEIMADGGLEDIFLPYNIVGRSKLDRLAALARRVRLSVTADSSDVVAGLSAAMHASPRPLPVLVEFDTGLGRCGVATPAAARELARTITTSPGLTFGGVMTHPHNDRSDPFVAETKALLTQDGIQVSVVSYGGTAGMWNVHTRSEVTEHRAGVYVYGDRDSVRHGVLTLDECALRVLATVVSRPTADRAILDAGSKALSSDLLGLEGFGLIEEYPEAKIDSLSEEHGRLDVSRSAKKPVVGERVTILPNHGCVVGNLFSRMIGHRHGRIETIWPVDARGASW